MNKTPTPRTDEALNTLLGMIHENHHLAAIDSCIAIQTVERELTAVTEHLTKAHETIGTMIDEIGMLQLKDKATTEQRDRLSEALERIVNNNVQDTSQTDYAYELGRMEGIAKVALQSLNQNDQIQPAKI